MKDNDKMAELARKLAKHLMSFARERRDDDKKAIAALHTEICKTFREEEEQPQLF